MISTSWARPFAIGTNQVLLIDPDAAKALQIPLQPLQSVSRGHLKFCQIPYTVELIQLPPRTWPNGLRAAFSFTAGDNSVEHILSARALERLYHGTPVTRVIVLVNATHEAKQVDLKLLESPKSTDQVPAAHEERVPNRQPHHITSGASHLQSVRGKNE